MQLDIQPLVIGTPRSGFSLLIAMIQRIMDHRKLGFARTPAQTAVTRLMPLFSYALNASYEAVFARHGLGDALLYNGEFQLLAGGPKWLVPGERTMGVRKYLGCRGHGDFLLVTKHPRLLFDYHGVRHSHDAPARWLQEADYAACLKLSTVRHPLDMFNSAVHSINALTSEYLQRFCPVADEHEVRRQIALNKLTDLRVCRGLMSHQLKYWREYLPCRGAYRELRWEDVIGDPVGSIQWVGQQMGLALPAEEAEAIWRPMDHRNLLIHHQHNYRKGHGIIGDWLTHLHPCHVELAGSMGLLDVMHELGYSLDGWAPETVQTEFRQTLDDFLARDAVFPMDDPVLAGFCFNKSNIDASAFNFKSFPGRKWAYVERSTLDSDALVLDVLEAAENGCEQVNAIVLELAASTTTDVEALMRSVQPACEALAGDDTARALLDQALLTEAARQSALWQALQALPPGSLVWGIGRDLLEARARDEAGFDALLHARGVRLADAALAGRSFAGMPVKRFDEWDASAPCTLLTPFSVPTRQQMSRLARSRAPGMILVDPYRRPSPTPCSA